MRLPVHAHVTKSNNLYIIHIGLKQLSRKLNRMSFNMQLFVSVGV